MSQTMCPAGRPSPGYRCRFCDEALHRGDSGCGCSQFRPDVTLYASLCGPCAEAVDVLTAGTVVGRIHRALVHEALVKYMPSSDG